MKKEQFIEVLVGDEARDMIFNVALRKGGVIRDVFKTNPIEMAKAVEMLGEDAMTYAKKANFWKSAAFGSFAATLWLSMRYAKKLSELKQENEVLKDEYLKVVDDEQDKA